MHILPELHFWPLKSLLLVLTVYLKLGQLDGTISKAAACKFHTSVNIFASEPVIGSTLESFLSARQI
jgi:hypothetical protein